MVKKKTEEKQPREYTKRQLSHYKKQQRRQKIILFSGISIIVVIALLVISGWFFGEYYPLNKTIAKVYDSKIKESMLIETMVLIGSTQQNVSLQTQSDYILSALVQNELSIHKAQELGMTASDDEIKEQMKNAKYPDNDAGWILSKAAVLLNKVVKDYITPQIPDSGSQIQMNAMMVESEEVVPEVKAKLQAGADFKTLAGEYATDATSKKNSGAYDWHPAEVLNTDIGSTVPADWAAKTEVNKGDISDALSDNTTKKQTGYWLLKITERDDDGASVWGLLCASKAEAEKVKPLLESTDNISALVDQYSDYEPSVQGHGNLGTIAKSDNISTAFNSYVFDSNTPIGVWGNPVKDTQYQTTGGAWIVQVVDKDNNRKYTEDDRNSLINNAYTKWSSDLWLDTADDISYTITEAQKQWAIDRATKEIDKIKSASS